MNRRNLPLTALRSFEAVGRYLSFSRAADALGVTHGAVSRQVATLERMLDVRLFDRHPGLAFTVEGQRLFDRIAPAFDRLAAALDDIQQREAQRVLAVNAPPTFAMKWLLPRLSRFQDRFPDVDVQISTGIEPLRALRMNEVDVVIRRHADPDGEGEPTPFLSSALLAVCAPDLLESNPVGSLGQMARFQLMEAETAMLSWKDWFALAGGDLPVGARIARYEQMFFVMEATLDGLGLALLPSALVVDDLAAGRLAIAWELPGVYERSYCHLLSPFIRERDIGQAFIDWLSDEGTNADDFGETVIRRRA